MDINEIIAMLQSDDYKERFKGEYYLIKMKLEKLRQLLLKYENGTLDFTPSCSLALLKNQASVMKQYITILERRAEIEKVKL